MHTAESFSTSSAIARNCGIAPKGSPVKVVSSPAITTRLPRCIQLHHQLEQRLVKELGFVDPHDLDLFDLLREPLAQQGHGRDGFGVVRLRAMRGDGGAVVALVDVRLEAGHALFGDARALEPPDQLLRLAGEHRPR